MPDSSPSWLTIKQATIFVDDTLHGDVDGYDFLLKALRSGHVGVRGIIYQWPESNQSIHAHLTDILRTSEKAELNYARSRAKVKLDELDYKEHLYNIIRFIEEDCGDWLTVKDNFLVAMLPGIGIWYILHDLRIRRIDLQKFMEERLYWKLQILGGRRWREENWLLMTAAFVMLERDGRLNDSVFPNHFNLLAAVRYLGGERLDERTIRDSIKLLYEMLVRPGDEGEPRKWTTTDPELDLVEELKRVTAAGKLKKSDDQQ